MELSINFSRLYSRKTLILGEAPVSAGLGAFPLYHKNKIPQSTQELLKLAFGDSALGCKSEEERLYSQLKEAFELDNLLSHVQPASAKGSTFNHEFAMENLERYIEEAGMYELGSSLPLPKFYGRHVIVFGRGGEALARYNAIGSPLFTRIRGYPGLAAANQSGGASSRLSHACSHSISRVV